MPRAGFKPVSSAATLLKFEQQLKPLGHHGRFISRFVEKNNSISLYAKARQIQIIKWQICLMVFIAKMNLKAPGILT